MTDALCLRLDLHAEPPFSNGAQSLIGFVLKYPELSSTTVNNQVIACLSYNVPFALSV